MFFLMIKCKLEFYGPHLAASCHVPVILLQIPEIGAPRNKISNKKNILLYTKYTSKNHPENIVRFELKTIPAKAGKQQRSKGEAYVF